MASRGRGTTHTLLFGPRGARLSVDNNGEQWLEEIYNNYRRPKSPIDPMSCIPSASAADNAVLSLVSATTQPQQLLFDVNLIPSTVRDEVLKKLTANQLWLWQYTIHRPNLVICQTLAKLFSANRQILRFLPIASTTTLTTQEEKKEPQEATVVAPLVLSDLPIPILLDNLLGEEEADTPPVVTTLIRS